MCSPGYMRMVDEQNEYVELLPVGPMYDHPKSDCRAACFSDVVVRKEKAYVNYSKHDIILQRCDVGLPREVYYKKNKIINNNKNL